MIDRSQIEKVISSDNKQSVIDGILGMVFSSVADEVPWISEKLMELSKNKDLDIAGLSLTCFGHLARLHSNIGDYDKVISLLRSKQDDPDLQGRAEDALEDISLFLSGNRSQAQVGLKNSTIKRSSENVFGFQMTFLSVKTGYWDSIQPILAQIKTMIVGYEKYD